MDCLLLAYAVVLGLAAGELISVGVCVFPDWFSWSVGLDRDYKERAGRVHRLRAAGGFLAQTNFLAGIVRGGCIRCGGAAGRFRWWVPAHWAAGGHACAECGYKLAPAVLLPQLVVMPLTAVVVYAGGLTLPMLLALFSAWMWTCIAFISVRSGLIPDALTLPLVWIHLLASACGVGIAPDAAVVGAMTGYLVPWAAYHAVRILFDRELLGHGNFKATSAIGAMAGPEAALLALGFACVAKVGENLLRCRRAVTPNGLVPMGPWLALPALVFDIALLRIDYPASLW